MSIADKVGQSSSFGRSRRSDRGRAKAITEGAIPSYELVRLALTKVSPTPLNPRRNFGTKEEMTRFGEELSQVQLAACLVVSRDAYLRLWPSHADAIGADCEHVLLNGERRYRSALHVGLEQLDFVVRDDLASSKEEFVDNLLAENLDREDFDVIERARGVQQLVDVCAENEGERGARSRAAERLGKDRSWVTNQLALLTLPASIQDQLSAGTVSERDGRLLARHLNKNPGLDTEDLLEHLASAKEAASQQREDQQRLVDAGRQALERNGPESMLSADNKLSPTAHSPAGAAENGAAKDTLLSADNKLPLPPASPATPTESGAASGLLSADNKPEAPSTLEVMTQAPVGSVRPAPSVPTPTTSQDNAESHGAPSAAGRDAALIALEGHAQDAAEFTARLQSITDLHREAAEVDRVAADKLLIAIREQIEQALGQFPSDIPGL